MTPDDIIPTIMRQDRMRRPMHKIMSRPVELLRDTQQLPAPHVEEVEPEWARSISTFIVDYGWVVPLVGGLLMIAAAVFVK